MTAMTKEESIQELEQIVNNLRNDTEDTHSALVISVDSDTSIIRMHGLNLDLDEIMELLTEAATMLSESVSQRNAYRTLN